MLRVLLRIYKYFRICLFFLYGAWPQCPHEDDIPEEAPEQLDLFTDYEALEKKKAAEAAADDKERRLQKATLLLQAKYGKNAVLKGMNLSEDGTTRLRNEQVGGHKA